MAYIQGRVQRCDNGNGIYATITDNFGNIAMTDVYGLFYSNLAYPGYRITASAGGFSQKQHTVTEHEISVGWVTICLDEVPTYSCFTAETRVRMADGSEKLIYEVCVGDLVLAQNGQNNRVIGIETPFLGARLLYSINGCTPFITAEHPIWCGEDWKAIDPSMAAQENSCLVVAPLTVGDSIFMLKRIAEVVGDEVDLEPELKVMRLSGINSVSADPQMILYNLLLDGNHTYFANGCLVHNKIDGPY